MKQVLPLLLVITFSIALNAQIWEDNFNDGDISDWTLYDVDGDGHNWTTSGSSGIDGSDCLISHSFVNGLGALMPHNIIVSPPINLIGTSGKIDLFWKAYAQDQAWPREKYKVVISNSPLQADVEAGDIIFEETLFFTGNQIWLERQVDISEYLGQVIYISFVHFESRDWYAVNIDDVYVGKAFTVNVSIDENENCVRENGEPGVPNILVNISDNDETLNQITNAEGYIKTNIPAGTYDISVIAPNTHWDVCNNNLTVTYDGDEEINLDFGLQSNSQCPYPLVSISSPRLRRCFDSHIFVDYCNHGTLPLDDAIVTVNLHEQIEVISSNQVYTQNGNTFTFQVEDLGVFECGKIVLTIKVDCNAELGKELCYDANITDPCSNGPRYYERECQEVIGSYDPNDKRAFPLSGTDEYKILPNETIKYQIRFQNTGTDTAFNILVEDVISNQLDIRTLSPGASSHPFEMEILEGRQVNFRFDNIMLPDSNVDLLGSNGFFTYYIKQLSDHPNDTKILNTGAIFFDFNDPIITNTTTHIVDDGIVAILDLDTRLHFSVSPNPAVDDIKVEILTTEWTSGTISIYDITGELMNTQQIIGNTIYCNLNQYDPGIYLIRLIEKEGKSVVKKLLVDK